MEARKHIAESCRFYPQCSLQTVRKANFFRDPELLESYLAALWKAGASRVIALAHELKSERWPLYNGIPAQV